MALSMFGLYRSEQEVVMMATHMIPAEEMRNTDRLEVAVRPF